MGKEKPGKTIKDGFERENTRTAKTASAPNVPPPPGGKHVPAPAEETGVSEQQQRSSAGEVADFLNKMKSLSPQAGAGNGRLIFAMDATMSRRPTWDMALGLQADMFDAVRQVGGLDVQLVYFRGAGECRSSKWVSNPTELARLMTTVDCRGGHTQIRKVLTHARRETESKTVNALVYVGDCIEEDIDELCALAGELALFGLPVFVFQEGHDPHARAGFKEIARLTRGAWCPFDAGSASQLRALLSAVAVYAAGGRQALEMLEKSAGSGAAPRALLEQLKAR